MKKSELNKIIRNSLNLDELEDLNEGYIARSKTYELNTDMLLAKTKEGHKKLYDSYVEAFNLSNAKLDSSDKRIANDKCSDFRGLKIDEQYNANAAYFHELYFANISDPYSEITTDSIAHMRLNRDFGTFDDWQRDFVACAMSCRNGWALTVYSFFHQKYINIIVDDHSSHLIPCNVLISLDMWEHARRDYLNNKNDYIVAMMREFNWQIIENRFKKNEMMIKALESIHNEWM